MGKSDALPIDSRLKEYTDRCDARRDGNMSFLRCGNTSFYDLAQAVFGHPSGGETGKPFRRVCSTMRKSGAKCLVINEHVERESYFLDPEQYPAVVEELKHLENITSKASTYVLQLTFFSSDTPYEKVALPPAAESDQDASDHSILASLVIIGMTSPTIVFPNGLHEHHYMFEGVVEFPTFVVNRMGDQIADGLTGAMNTQPVGMFGKGKEVRCRIPNNYWHVGDLTLIHVGGNGYVLEAAYFCQQNQMTSVCAHSAIKMLLWHAKEDRYQPSTFLINTVASRLLADDPKFTGQPDQAKSIAATGVPASIQNEASKDAMPPCGIDCVGKSGDVFDPTEGLTVEEIQAVCQEYEAETIVLDCKHSQHIPPYEYAYSLVESGIPTVLVFASSTSARNKPTYHVMPVVGHTMNTDEWLPFAAEQYRHMPLLGLHSKRYDSFIPSCEWASHLIVHDDMLGPYMCIGPRTLACDRLFDTGDDGGRIHFVIGVVPRKRKFPSNPYEAQQLGGRYLEALWSRYTDDMPESWKKRLVSIWSSEDQRRFNTVLRTQIMRAESYSDHLREAVDHRGGKCRLSQHERKALRRGLPERFWMVEFSLPYLFSTHRAKLGEILVSFEAADKLSNLQENSIDSPLLVRMMNRIDMFTGVQMDAGFTSHSRLFSRKTTEVEY